MSWKVLHLSPHLRLPSHWSSLEQTPPPIWQGDEDVQQPDVSVVPLQTETWIMIDFPLSNKYQRKILVHQYNNLHPEGHFHGNLGSCCARSQGFPHIGHHRNRHRLLSGKEMKTYSSLMSTWCHCKLKHEL